jgi:hypothetical protein
VTPNKSRIRVVVVIIIIRIRCFGSGKDQAKGMNKKIFITPLSPPRLPVILASVYLSICKDKYTSKNVKETSNIAKPNEMDSIRHLDTSDARMEKNKPKAISIVK